LGIINGKGVLINPTHCIGHGACAPTCSSKAIKLVLGTAKRGMDIPHGTKSEWSINAQTHVHRFDSKPDLIRLDIARPRATIAHKSLLVIPAR